MQRQRLPALLPPCWKQGLGTVRGTLQAKYSLLQFFVVIIYSMSIDFIFPVLSNRDQVGDSSSGSVGNGLQEVLLSDSPAGWHTSTAKWFCYTAQKESVLADLTAALGFIFYGLDLQVFIL